MLQAFVFNLSNVITPAYLSDLGLEKYYFGYFFALWSFGMLVSSPIWGTLGDLYGKKRFVIIGLLIYGFSQAVFYYSDSISILIFFRVLSGVGVGAPVTLLFSYLISTSKKVEIGLAKRMAFLTIGATLSYKVAGELSTHMQNELFLMQSLLTSVLILMVVIIVKNDDSPHCVLPKQYNLFNSLKEFRLLNIRNTMFLFSITLTTMTFVTIDRFIDLYVIDQGLSPLELGNLKTIFGIVTIMANFYIIPKLRTFLGNVYILQTTELLMAIIVLVTFQDNQLIILLYTIFLGYVVLRAIFTVSEQLYLSNQVEKSDLGRFMGLRQSFTCLGMLLGPIIGGHIYTENPINLFVFCVVSLLLSSIILSVIKSPESFRIKILAK